MSQDLGPAHPGQHQIENDQVVGVGIRQIQSAVSISGRIYGEAVGGQAARDETRDLGFILYQENPHGQPFRKTAELMVRGEGYYRKVNNASKKHEFLFICRLGAFHLS
jgi:hypothetical protein